MSKLQGEALALPSGKGKVSSGGTEGQLGDLTLPNDPTNGADRTGQAKNTEVLCTMRGADGHRISRGLFQPPGMDRKEFWPTIRVCETRVP